MTTPSPIDPVDWPGDDFCDICGAPMETLAGPETWLDITECAACGWSPDDAWKVGMNATEKETRE